jgi:hypothetical protein
MTGEPTFEEKIASCAVDLSLLKTGWRPSEADLHDAVPLWNWWPLVHRALKLPALGGYAEHPTLGNDVITTSPVLWIDPSQTIARCLSRWYRLSGARHSMLHIPLTAWEQVEELHRRVMADLTMGTGQYPLKSKDEP